MSPVIHVLIVANRTAATEELCDAVRHRSERSPCRFHLVVPACPKGLHRIVDPEVSGWDEAAVNLAVALGPLSEAAAAVVDGHVGDADPLASIQDAIHRRRVDELLISTLPSRISRWVRLDLVSKARDLGLPVEHVEARGRARAAAAA